MMGNASAEQSAKKVEEEDGLKTLECLRGRLLAERGASKAANEEADKLGNKLIELENKLKKEVKWRNKAEKRLKSLIKKLESKNIVYVISDESSDHSSSLGKSDLSYVSSSPTASFSNPNKQPEDNDNKTFNSQMRNAEKSELEEPIQEIGPTLGKDLKHTAPSERHNFSQIENIKFDKTISERSNDSQCSQNNSEAKSADEYRFESSVEKETNGENNEKWDESSVDDSMALVLVTTQSTTPTTTIEPLIANNVEVKDVLNTVSFSKERLQSSMGMRHMVKAGF